MRSSALGSVSEPATARRRGVGGAVNPKRPATDRLHSLSPACRPLTVRLTQGTSLWGAKIQSSPFLPSQWHAPARATMPTVPRPLSDRERAILDLLLSIDFPGVNALREQALSASAEGAQMVVGLVIDERLPRAQVVGRTPVQAVVDGDGYDGGVLLFVDDGRLSALEHWWVTEEAPDVFPPISAVGRPVVASG